MAFRLYHLLIERSYFRSGLMPVNDHHRRVVKVKPNYDMLMELIYRVGRLSNWHLRREYFEPERVRHLRSILGDKKARLYLFQEHGETVGFCQVLDTDMMKERCGKNSTVTEIYKIGLFPEKIGQGRGAFFLSAVLSDLFQDYDRVYLNTRDSNHVKSVPFYQRMGFRVIGEEMREDDLIIIPDSVQA